MSDCGVILQRSVQNHAQLANMMVAVTYLVHAALVDSHTLSRPFNPSPFHKPPLFHVLSKTLADKHNSAAHGESASAWTAKLHK